MFDIMLKYVSYIMKLTYPVFGTGFNLILDIVILLFVKKILKIYKPWGRTTSQ